MPYSRGAVTYRSARTLRSFDDCHKPLTATRQSQINCPSVFVFPRFDEKKTEAGCDAHGYYHERKDENRNFGLGPKHGWSGHATDAFAALRSL